MATKLVHSFQPCTWLDAENVKNKSLGFIRVSQRTKDKQGIQTFMTMRSNTRASARHKPFALKISSSLNNTRGSVKESGGFPASRDESMVLKNKSRKIEPYLNGRCIYLVGMMGSGKTTIGRLLSEALDYSFLDCDVLVEENAGGMSVAEIFKQHGEAFFRDKETEVLEKLSQMHRLVVSTGGGAVIRPINWRHMRGGISVWLNVPLECLARRISAVGTDSRPLLHGESGDAYSKALARLEMLFEERAEAYANATIQVSLENIAAKLGHVDVDNITANIIAIEVLEQIESFLKKKSSSAT
uniref:shikimate kinase n=1 Tax=Opuntia streptacantha TaxID=393608 RepID=A0A7C9DJ98_OPUST